MAAIVHGGNGSINHRNQFIAIDKMTLDIGFFYGSENLYNSGKHKVQKALQFYTDKLKGKKEDQIKDFIYNHYYEEKL